MSLQRLVVRKSYKVKPTRRVWISKPGTDEKRPLGIPVMEDQALQALFKMALEPQNGKRDLNLIHTGSDLGTHVMMQER